MGYSFEEERKEVLAAAKDGIRGNIKLSGRQKRYVKNLLLFALMRASNNGTVTPRNFLKLVNKLFKEFLLKIIAEGDDEDGDWEEALNVELNNIIASDKMLSQIDFEQLLSPENITIFLKGATNGVSQKDLIKRLISMRDLKTNYRETPEEEKERKHRRKEYELMQQRMRTMAMERGARGGRERG